MSAGTGSQSASTGSSTGSSTPSTRKVRQGKPPTTDTRARKKLGDQGELWVAEALMAQGFTILASKLRKRWGEIDLIARKETLLWFVEVKTRRVLGENGVELSYRQQQRLTRMAYGFLQKLRPAPETVFFTVATVQMIGDKPQISFIEQAFEATF